MKRYYDIGFTILVFSFGLYIGDYLTDQDGQASIVSELVTAVLLLTACFVFDLFTQWRNKNK